MTNCKHWLFLCICLVLSRPSYAGIVEDATKRISDLEASLAELAVQAQQQQLEVEERVRSEGISGIKQVRYDMHGTQSYFDNTHSSSGVAAIHDHTNYMDTLGMGEVIVVLNGVEFRTRHNDYRLVEPNSSTTGFRAVRELVLPQIPPSVLNQTTLEGQINEMRQYFFAFKNQNITHREYRPYFKPAICYLEGFWSLEKNIQEPFESDRHSLFASSWAQLKQQILYTSYTGNKDLLENMAYLPTAITSVNMTTGKAEIAQWNYRILCKLTSMDIPLRYFSVQDDLAARTQFGLQLKDIENFRSARFRLNELDFNRHTKFTLMDKIMQEIPGLDNNPSALNEDAFAQTEYDTQYANNDSVTLNTGYYHRMFKTRELSDMGLNTVDRGYSDELMFVAENTQPMVPAMPYTNCIQGNCVTKVSRFSYAIPLEIIYLSPLITWNPYNILVRPAKDYKIPARNGRVGNVKNPALAYNGASRKEFYFLTPVEFYKTLQGLRDPADTTPLGGVGVLDPQGNLRQVMSSGIPIISSEIKGIGQVRFRYPIAPVHGEGSTVWKDLSVVRDQINDLNTAKAENSQFYVMAMSPSPGANAHVHSFLLANREFFRIQKSETVTVTSSINNDHSHDLQVWINPVNKAMEYKLCDGLDICPDRHGKAVRLDRKPIAK